MSESPKAVFISYASKDVVAALRIAVALRAAGVEVWFDQNELGGGDAWDRKIRAQIGSCALFVPVISAETQARHEGYFRLEWHLAEQRSLLIAKGRPFIVPVSVDATTERGALVPEAFLAVQWTRLPGGETGEAFCARVKKLLGLDSETAAPRPRPAQPAGSGASPRVGRALRARQAWGIGAVVAVVLVGIFGWSRWREKSDAVTTAQDAARRSAQPTSEAAAVNDKSIAVLPFANLSDDKENTAFFSDGMHEDILTTLANIPELRVISRTSVMEYRGTTKKIPQIARELGVAYILEGSVRRAGNQIRLTGQLIRAAKDEHLWAKSYDRELTTKDMFGIQAALATEIAGALHAAISPAAKKLVERRPTENLAAYDLFLNARTPVGGTRNLANRVKLLEQAVNLDPDFAEAWGVLATAHARFINTDLDHTPERLAQADAAIARAVRLAPDTPEVMLAFGSYARLAYRDLPRAAAQYEKVIQLQPNNSGAYLNLGFVRRRQGRWAEGLSNIRKAAELDQGFATGALVAMLACGRRWDEAIAMRRQINLSTDERSLLRDRLPRLVFQATGSTKEAAEILAQLTSAERDSPPGIREQKYWATVKGDFAEWKRLDGVPSNADPGEPDWSEAVDAAMVLAAHGDLTGARTRLGNHPTQLRSTLELQPANARSWGGLALMEALLGEHEVARRDARKAVELVPESRDAWDGPPHRFNLAKVYAWTGDKAQAVAELARLLRIPVAIASSNQDSPLSVHTLRVDPEFAPLRGDPQFEALLKDPKNHAPLF